MAKRVFLHVGTPKSGTTYLQEVLWQNAEQLQDNGFLLPGRFKVHYAAAKGVTRRKSLKRSVDVNVGKAWFRLARQANRWDGNAGISHELLAPATSEQATAAISLLDNAEVHIVLTARALHKQVPASWQEQVKGGNATPFDEFLRRIENGSAREQRLGDEVSVPRPEEWFWEVQDLALIARQWGDGLPPDRVHIVTVPAESSAPSQLWQRFASVLDLDPDLYDAETPIQNISLGVVETELLRRVHAVRDRRFRDADRHRWTRKLLASETLGEWRGSALLLPESERTWIEQRTAAMIDEIERRRYDVVGTLDDLRWRPPAADARSIESVTDHEIAEASAWTIARLQEQLVQRQPPTRPPPVGPDDGVEGILELLEHIRAADSSKEPRPAPVHRTSPTDRLRKSITALRGR